METSASRPASDTDTTRQESANQSQLDARLAVNDQMLHHVRASLDSLHKAADLLDDERDSGSAGSDLDQDALVAHVLEGNLDDSLLTMNAAARELEDRAAHLAKLRAASAVTDGDVSQGDVAELISRLLREARDGGWSDAQCTLVAQELVTRKESVAATHPQPMRQQTKPAHPDAPGDL